MSNIDLIKLNPSNPDDASLIIRSMCNDIRDIKEDINTLKNKRFFPKTVSGWVGLISGVIMIITVLIGGAWEVMNLTDRAQDRRIDQQNKQLEKQNDRLQVLIEKLATKNYR